MKVLFMVKIHHFIVINIVGCCCHYVTIIRGFTRHDMQTILTRQANFDLLIGESNYNQINYNRLNCITDKNDFYVDNLLHSLVTFVISSLIGEKRRILSGISS